MSGKKHKGSLCKIHMECMECGKVVYSENPDLHIQRSHNNNKNVKFNICNDI